MKKELSIVVPTYNEKENIKILIPKLLNVIENNNIDGEIIIVEDQSSDGSDDLLKQLEDEISILRVIFRKPPNSLAKAWMDGFSAASKCTIVCIDADLCHNPEYFPVMLKYIGEYDIVIGSRYLHNRLSMMEDKSILAVYLSILGQYITRLATGFTESDISHSFRMFKKDIFDSIKNNLKHEGNIFLIEFLFYAKNNGAKVIEIPIEYGKRIYGSTKLKISREGFRYLYFIFKLFIKTRILT